MASDDEGRARVKARVDSVPDLESTDTTTWGGSSAPPVIVEADAEESIDDTLVLPSEPGLDSDLDGDGDGVAAAGIAIDASGDGTVDEDNLATVVTSEPLRSAKVPLAPSSSLRPMLLERIQPSLGRGERLRLDATHWKMSLGRGEQSDLRLYTESASREHALIAGDEAGNWVLTPAEGKSVSIDGEDIAEAIVLEVGMNIILGRDHLRCVSEGVERADMNHRARANGSDDRRKSKDAGAARRSNGSRLGWWVIGLCALTGIALIVYSVLGG